MFASIRRHQKWLWIVIMVLVIISFVVYLDPSYSGRRGFRRQRGPSQEFGTVNGRPLSREEFLDAYQDVRLESKFSTGRWPEEDEAGRRMFNADNGIRQRLVLLEKARELGIRVNDEAVADWIANVFRDPKTGKFNMEEYRQFVVQTLRPEGVTEADLQRFARNQIAISHLYKLAGMSGGLVSRGDAEAAYRQESEQMNTQVVLFNYSNYLAGVTVNDAAVAQYYTNFMSQYRIPDRMQVSYVKYDATNYLAAADQFIAQRTNLAVELQAEYQRRGPDAFKDSDGKVMTEAAAIARLKADMRRGYSLIEARKQATSFAQQLFDLYEKQPKQTNNLERVAAALGIQAFATEPFSRSEGPSNLKVPDGFSQMAFALTPEQPMASEPIIGEDAAYVIALKRLWPSEMQPLAAIREKVVADYRKREAVDAARKAGEAFYMAVTNGAAQKKSFDVVCAESRVQPVLLPPYSMNTRSLRGWEGRVDLSLLKDAASTLVPGKTSDFMPTQDGGLVLHLISRVPVDDAVAKAELPAFTTQLRATRERQAFSDWFRKQYESAQFSGLPKLSRNTSAAPE
ncbi:MAG TPA: SurA N-terminal domain-containing protein [Candidatus Nitrosotalea sp.]|nr:SurA N-terminal domain-containing protein [Candidatus Nitrosotalea sp.]